MYVVSLAGLCNIGLISLWSCNSVRTEDGRYVQSFKIKIRSKGQLCTWWPSERPDDCLLLTDILVGYYCSFPAAQLETVTSNFDNMTTHIQIDSNCVWLKKVDSEPDGGVAVAHPHVDGGADERDPPLDAAAAEEQDDDDAEVDEAQHDPRRGHGQDAPAPGKAGKA